MLSRRASYAYMVLLAGAILVLLRRLLLPNFFELEGLPLDIANASALNSCYGSPAISTCGDGVVVILTAIGVAVAAGWGSAGRAIFAAILVVLPIGLYLSFVPIWAIALLLALLPLALDLGVRMFYPQG
jgi:hypothetical protein